MKPNSPLFASANRRASSFARLGMLILVVSALAPARGANTFVNTGALGTARTAQTSTLLPNGKVLVAGGQNAGNAVASAETYDPSTGVWTATGSLATARYYHTATMLPNGRVLVAGGFNASGAVGSAELYDPATGTWSATGALASVRNGHTATLLANGKVLVAGGNNGSGSALASAELYDFTTGTWTATGPLATARQNHTATLLPDGKVLIAAGSGSFSLLASAELFDPAGNGGAGTWSATGSIATARYLHTATLLPNGKVLVAGGEGSSGYLTSAQLYDPATGNWTNTGAFTTARSRHTASLLPNGKVIIAGGFNGTALTSAQIYDPTAGTWSATGALVTGRYNHTATLLPNGRMLVAGSATNAELYDAAVGAWSGTGALATARFGHTGTLLPNGKVLVVGGTNGSAVTGVSASAELYTIATGVWSATGSLAVARLMHTATLLPNGKVLVAGGYSSPGGVDQFFNSVEVYDPATGTWSSTGTLLTARRSHTATLLPDGRVLVVGGISSGGTVASEELYDPATGTWRVTGNLGPSRILHTATLLPNGKVLVAGGLRDTTVFATSQIYDPATDLWSATGTLASARFGHTATLLPNGKLLVAGGSPGDIASAELYDPATGLWAATGALIAGRSSHTATFLPNGRVLVAGGIPAGTEIYDPATGTWSATGSLNNARSAPTATLVANGKVLVAGGVNPGPVATTELFDVGLAFSAAWQPQISSASFDAVGKLVLTGTGFRGISSASGGNGAQDSPTSYPVVQLRRLDNEQSVFLLSDPVAAVSATGFTSVPVAPFSGYALVTVFANGIPSAAAVVFLPTPDIGLFQPASTGIGDGGTKSFGTMFVGSPVSLTFTIKNPGTANLTGLTIPKDGANAADFTVTANPTAPVLPGGSTTFTIEFAPATSGTKTAAIHIANNVAVKNPYDINLTGQAYSFTTDTDGDGLNDASEYQMAALGFDWQVSQPALVNTLFSNLDGALPNLNAAGLYTESQVQALHIGTPLLARDAGTGEFTLTLRLRKTTVLGQPFAPFPFVPGQTTINAAGEIEFTFSVPDDAAFFRLEAQ